MSRPLMVIAPVPLGKRCTRATEEDVYKRQAHADRCIRIPIRAEARCLNLSNAAAILAYEALRQLDFPGLTGEGAMKGEAL